MPQMAPISWLILFVIFSIAFMLFNILNYYCFFYKNSNNKNLKKYNEVSPNFLNWKW